MKYKIRLNENPEYETEVKHVEQIDENRVVIGDVGRFEYPHKSIAIEKIELIGEDNEIYAMRKIPSHLVVAFTPEMELEIQFNLFIKRDLVQIEK